MEWIDYSIKCDAFFALIQLFLTVSIKYGGPFNFYNFGLNKGKNFGTEISRTQAPLDLSSCNAGLIPYYMNQTITLG